MNTWWFAILLAGPLLLAACGSDSTGSSASPVPASPTKPPVTAESPATSIPTLQSAQPPAATPVPDVVAALKADLAARLKLTPNDIAVVSLSPFTWPDGCLGLGGPGVVCTQALVPGWLAMLRTPDGREYRYRGSGARFALEP